MKKALQKCHLRFTNRISGSISLSMAFSCKPSIVKSFIHFQRKTKNPIFHFFHLFMSLLILQTKAYPEKSLFQSFSIFSFTIQKHEAPLSTNHLSVASTFGISKMNVNKLQIHRWQPIDRQLSVEK
jgi:hypothetical protein